MPCLARGITFRPWRHRFDSLPFGGKLRRKTVRPVIVIENEVGVTRGTIAARFHHHRLISLIFIEAEVPPAMSGAVFILLAAEDKTAVFCSLFIIEEHSRSVAVVPRILLTLVIGTRKLRVIRDDH